MIQIKNNSAFVKSLDQIAVFTDECNIHFNDEGIKILAFDNAQIIYLEYFLSKDGIGGEIPSAVFGINITEFNKILSKINSQDLLYLDIKDNCLDLIIKGQYSRSFSFPQKIVDEKKLDVYTDDYPINFQIEGDILKDIFISARVVSDAILFDCKDKELAISSEGIYGRYKTKISANTKAPVKAKFSSIHLSNMLKNASLDTKIDVKLSPRHPFYISYSIGNNNLRFFLAHMFI
ncbi:MAG: hypothetical protein COT14_02135 [Candidatus Diapherotrites archaeon CG08_land_8_20_14_0_20_30_16]|nr:MAG: hypothetical protein COT14_02135 [Candidatus Diapherotrites archaeon CG08_land_8_20_14_0_20_30_16]